MSSKLSAADDLQLLRNGYEPIPVSGKAAVAEGWQAGRIDITRLQAMREVYQSAQNTGLRTGSLAAIDIDVADASHTEQITTLAEKIFGETPLWRFGSKGMMLLYNNPTPIRKVAVLTETDAKVEVLGQGLQFVAFGIHPGTGRPFEWRKQDFEGTSLTPLNTAIDTLPTITPEQINDFVLQCAACLTACGYGTTRVRHAEVAEKKERQEGIQEDSQHNIDRAKEHLQNCVDTGRVATLGQLGNDTIYELACTLMDRFALSEDTCAKLMLDIWYPHCIPNTLEDDCRQIIAHAATYLQNEPGAQAQPPVAQAFGDVLASINIEPEAKDDGAPKQIILQDDNFDTDDAPISAGQYMKLDFPPLRELVPTWCERNINTILEGPAATQKSRNALQDAIAISVGLPVLGKEPAEQCECIYLNYENSPEEMARRIHMICQSLRQSNKDAPVDPSGVHIWELRKNPRPLIVVKRDGCVITRFGQRVLSLIAKRMRLGKHTLVVFDGLMDAIIFQDNTRNDDTVAMSLIRLIDSWCMEYDFTAYSIMHPSRSSERGQTVGSYATAWTTKPRAIQTFKRVLAPSAPGGPKAKITEDTPLDHIWYQRRVQKRSNGPEGDRMLLEYWKGGLRPHFPVTKVKPAQDEPVPAEFDEEVPF